LGRAATPSARSTLRAGGRGERTRWRLGLLGSALACATALAAQPPPPKPPTLPEQPPATRPADPAGTPSAPSQDPQQPVFRTGINFVRVDVIVTDKQGSPVADLTANDFEVFEDSKRQAIETFKLISLGGVPEPGSEPARPIRTEYDQESEAARDDVRVFVILLDDYHVRRGASMVVREPLMQFLKTQIGPLDMVGLMYPLTPVRDVTLTRNHDAVARAIERFEGRKFDYRPRNALEERYSMYPAEVVERVRNEVSLSALEGLVTYLGGLREGRKAVILVSEGYSNYLPPQLRDPIAEMPGIGNPNRNRPPSMGGDSLTEDRARFFQNIDIQSRLRDVYSAANRSNTAIYALDPRGLAPFEFDINERVGLQVDRQSLQETQDTLRVLADETDGRAIVNRNDLEGGLRQVVRDSSAYYLLGYNSTEAPTDGKFHEIKVRVKRSGVQVRSRRGYWALTADDAARATAPPAPGPDPQVTRALASIEAPNRARVARTWIGTAPGENGRTRVTFTWEPAPVVPGDRRPSAARVSLVAGGAGNASYFRGEVVAPAPEGTAAAVAPRGGRADFEADPGRVSLRLTVRGIDGELLDNDFIDIDVPDYTAPLVHLSTPVVLRARTPRELQALTADPQPLASASRDFRRTDRVVIRVAASGPGGVPPTLSARLLNRAGQPMSDLAPQPSEALGEGIFHVDVPLASLPAGDFIVELRASSGDAEARQMVGFRVGS
jgi:VWFA-related protein